MHKWIKRFFYFIGGIIVFLLIILVILQTHSAKNLIRNKLVVYLSQKTNTEFRISNLDYSLPKWIELEGVFVQDLKKDTLMYGKLIKVDLAMLKILSGEYQVDKILLEEVYVNLDKKRNDTVFNYQFLMDAFKSKSENLTEEDTSVINFSLKEVTLKNIRFKMLDEGLGTFTDMSVANLDLRLKNMDVNKMNFDIDRFFANELKFQMLITKAADTLPQLTTTTTQPYIKLDSLIIKNSLISYEDEINKIKTTNEIGSLQVAGLTNKANRDIFKTKFIRLHNSDIEFNHSLTDTRETINKPDTIAITNSYGFVIDEIDLQNNQVTYNNTAAPVKVNGLDYEHIAFTGLQLNAKNNSYNNGIIQSTILGFSFRDKSGFAIDSLRGMIEMDSSHLQLKEFIIKTAGSTIQAEVLIYPSIMDSPGKTASLPINHLVITNSRISKKDLELLANGIAGKYKKQLDELGDLQMNANITGNSKQLLIHDLSIRSGNQQTFTLQVSGSATNATDVNKLSGNLHIKTFTISKSMIAPFIEQSKQKLQLPPVISITGLLEGNMERLRTNLQSVSAFGKVYVKGSLANLKHPQKLKYDLVMNATNFETGKWIYRDSLLGKITGTIIAKGGNGFDFKKSSLKTTATIHSFQIQKNVYNNIKLKLDLENALVDYNAMINDESLQLSVQGDANIKTNYPTVNAIVDLQEADLFALGFVKDSMKIKMLANIDLANLSPQHLDATIRIDSILVNGGNRKIFSDSILLVAVMRNDSTIINLASSLVDANLASNLTYEQMPDLAKEVMGYYLSTTTSPATKASPGFITANMLIKPNVQYKSFVKDLSFTDVGANITLSNSSTDSTVRGSITGKEIKIGTNQVSNVQAMIQGTPDSLHLLAKMDTVQAGNILLYDAIIKAGLTKENISLAINSKDAKKTEQFALAVVASPNKTTHGFDIHLKDSLTLNYNKWQVNNSNMIRTSKEGFTISDFDISSGQQKISIASTSSEFSAPIKVAIDNFKLSNLTTLFIKDTMLLEGLLNADITAGNFDEPIPTLDGTAQLDSIYYGKMLVGNLQLKAISNNNIVTLDGKLSGNGNDVNLTGDYSRENIDLKILLNPITIASLQPFTQGNLARSSGTISGLLTLNGAAGSPEWNGELQFNKVQTTAAKFGTFLQIDNQKVMFQYPTISFNNFTIRDSTGNPLKINGTLTQSNQNNFVSDLYVTSENFNAINSTASDNKIMYGKGIVEMDVVVKGDLYAPDLSGNMLIKNGTDITYLRQNTVSTLKERNDVMEFVDMDTIKNLLAKKTALEVIEEDKNKITSKGSLQYNINLEIEQEAKFRILVDPATSDELQVQGKAQINMGVNPNGDLLLTGTYELKDGSYQLNYGPVKRKFNFQEGSNIILTGDPQNARANITAVYTINTSPIDLIGNEIGGLTPTQTNQYRRKVPFEVLLKIDGPVSKPLLSFDISLKEKAEGVSYELANTINNKLKQVRTDASLMNKQVFALLTLNRFLANESNDFFGGTGTSNTNLLANESVSGFLNAAVNEIAADLIKGVDIDINLKTVDDDPSAVRTDLNIMLGKSFMNDRLNVSFGKNFTVDGDDPSVKLRSGTNRDIQFIPDVNSTYKLSNDGRYILRAYRRTQYEAIMDGYFIETGFAFAFTMDYDKFIKLAGKKKK